MTALQANSISKCVAHLNSFKKTIKKQPITIKSIWSTIAEAVEREETNCVVFTLPDNIRTALLSKDYRIVDAQNDDGKFYNIFWGHAVEPKKKD